MDLKRLERYRPVGICEAKFFKKPKGCVMPFWRMKKSQHIRGVIGCGSRAGERNNEGQWKIRYGRRSSEIKSFRIGKTRFGHCAGDKKLRIAKIRSATRE